MDYEKISITLVMLKKKLIMFVLVLVCGFILSFPFTGGFIRNIIDNILPQGARVIYLSPPEVMLLKLKVALIAGVLLTLPLASYYTYSALKGRLEVKKSWFSMLFTGAIALILFLLGAGYAYFLMLPFFINYLYQNAASAGVMATYSVSQFISFVLFTTVIFGLVFEFPLAITILVRSGLVDRKTLVTYRYHTYISLLVVAAVITPPDVLSQVIIAAPLILFFELSLLFVKFVGKSGN
ncbi:MAG: twin-arginine translocase subunit TatC [ANME-2 cluster archaeon]|nr:twin-arginine translocase subunit TatC [ANME-2 cluster archaeon]